MSSLEQAITVVLVILATMLTRFISFLVFPNPEKMPKFIKYLGTVLPFATMGLLVVFSYKHVSFLKAPYGIPELIASCLVVFLHVYKRNMLLSIASGTIVYMFLVQKIF